MSTSPLIEANPNSLAELFSADPLSLSKQDIATICVELRRARAKWLVEDTAKQNKPKKKEKESTGIQLDIDDILSSLN